MKKEISTTLKEDAFYWVKLKPYQVKGHVEPEVPGWEPLQRSGGEWCRAGVIYRFIDREVEEVGAEITEPGSPVRCLLTPAQASAIRCAHADLQGTLQCHDQMDFGTHDWIAHALSIEELETAFPLILEQQ